MSDDVAARPLREQYEVAVRDLWTMLEESGDEYVVFRDRRRLLTRVSMDPDGLFRVSWESGDGGWVDQPRRFENLREAAFHGYQGPH
jgi:hypothetical protein